MHLFIDYYYIFFPPSYLCVFYLLFIYRVCMFIIHSLIIIISIVRFLYLNICFVHFFFLCVLISLTGKSKFFIHIFFGITSIFLYIYITWQYKFQIVTFAHFSFFILHASNLIFFSIKIYVFVFMFSQCFSCGNLYRL